MSAVIDPLPPIPAGQARAFRLCSCGFAGWYDYKPFSLSVPIIVFPCGHDPRGARCIDEAEFFAAVEAYLALEGQAA
jgi:hypothetical protein